MFRPMLCARVRDVDELRYPLLCTPKVDGIRVLVREGHAVTRSLKLVRNRRVQELVSALPEGLDGEVVAGNFQESTTAVMRADADLDFEYLVFDRVDEASYRVRARMLESLALPPFVRVLSPTLVVNGAELAVYEAEQLRRGYEGVVLRSPDGPYKFGRSTPTEGFMWKMKPVHRGTARVLAVVEQMENTNPVVRDIFGRARRPGGWNEGDGRAPKGTLGSLLVRDVDTGVTFSVGTGFSQPQRDILWASPPIGRLLEYKSQVYGSKDRPRFPVFLGFRDEDDAS